MFLLGSSRSIFELGLLMKEAKVMKTEFTKDFEFVFFYLEIILSHSQLIFNMCVKCMLAADVEDVDSL